MSIDVSIGTDPALLQRIQASSEYGGHVKHDWESKSFERFFEAVKVPENSSGDTQRSDADPSSHAAQPPNSGAYGSFGSGDGPLPGGLGLAGPSVGSALRTVAQFGANDRPSEVVGNVGPVIPTASRFGQIGPSGSEVDLDETVVAVSQLDSSAAGEETNAAAATPARSAVIIGLSALGAHVLVRSPDIGAGDADRLRYAIASELGWSGISLASFKLNGQNSNSFSESAQRTRVTRNTALASKSEFQIPGGGNP